jgi:membrane protease YdiL (CAAX protease family)
VILPLVIVYAATRAFWWAVSEPWMLTAAFWAEGALKIALWVPTAVLAVMALRGGSWRDAVGELGLLSPAWRGTGLVALATVPMVALLLSAGGWSVRPSALVSVALLGPLAEEVLYRGFFFQQLCQRARWPMWAAALASALAFAIAHHQDFDVTLTVGLLRNDLATPLTILGPPLLATLAGGCLFAWMTWRWRSLWPAIVLHGAMNFWWDITPRTVDPIVATIAHGTAIGLAILVTGKETKLSGIWESGNR